MMNRASLPVLYKITVITLGSICLLFALNHLPKDFPDWVFICLVGFALLITPRMSVTLPRARFILSFSDSLIFLAFILYGGYVAICLAAIEMFASCFYLRRNGIKFGKLVVSFNIFSAVLSTAFTFFVWSLFLIFSGISSTAKTTADIISTLGFLAISQFFVSSVLVSQLSSILTGESVWRIWKRDCFSSSLTQIAGAGLAGVAYKLIYYADVVTTAIVVTMFAIIYINFRQTVKEIDESINHAQAAEREKAEIEKIKAEEAQNHAVELRQLLDKETLNTEELISTNHALEHAAFHDFLTDLPNRTYLVERLNLLMQIGIKLSQRYCVLFLDLKHFKNINDRLGHNIGDRVLKLVGKRLVRILREKDTVARLGGDEFAIILTEISSIEEAQEIARHIYSKLTQPFLIQGNKIFADVNIGIAPVDADHQTPEDILRDADIAMHYAKKEGGGIGIFNKKLRARFLEQLNLEADLRFALERKELSMHYQPFISLKDGELFGFEALLRWQHPEKGFISPAQFVPIAEESNLIIPITKWILRETCLQIGEWQKLSPLYNNLLVSVNISGKHLSDDSLIKDVQKALKISGISPASLKLEITESVAMENAEQSIKILNALKSLGVRLSMDDFGTGYSSLSYLHRLPFNSLKIDRSFVTEVGEQGQNAEVLETIVSLAKNLKMRTFAEGIETESQLKILQNLGCDYGQGYLMSKPLPTDEMEKLLYQRRAWIPTVKEDSDSLNANTIREENLHIF